MNTQTRAKVFVDGQAGTTGLKIFERLADRDDVEVLRISEALRKDRKERTRLLNAADFVFLCLPDSAAKESVSLIDTGNTRTRILDASTAHRTNADWVYGIPELSTERRLQIANAPRVAIPGCHASGFNLAVAPLIAAGILEANYPFVFTSLTGYSGGGKPMIADYEAVTKPPQLSGSRPYALNLWHKHLPEMQAISGLSAPPIFQPIVGSFRCGMIASVPLYPRLMQQPHSAKELHQVLSRHYEGQLFVKVMPYEETPTIDGGFLDPQALNGTNKVELFVFGNEERIMLSTRYDNLGKGASGAAVQCLNLMMSVAEDRGLT